MADPKTTTQAATRRHHVKATSFLMTQTISSCDDQPKVSGSGEYENGLPVPVVLMHGILGVSGELAPTVELIKSCIPGVYVFSAEIGNGRRDSMFLPMPKQVEMFAEMMAADERLRGGFNLVGFSQGGLIGRGYIQKFSGSENGKYPPVFNFISWVSPQAGQFGVPKVTHSGTPHIVRRMIHAILPQFYNNVCQENISWSNYWRDPKHISSGTYHEKSAYLADLNNEREEKNPRYKEKISNLHHYVLVKSSKDDILSPRETGWFEFWDESGNGAICPLENTRQYQEDWLGLRTLDESGRLHRYISHCAHEDYCSETYLETFKKQVIPFLDLPSNVDEHHSKKAEKMGVRVQGSLAGGWCVVDDEDCEVC